MIFKHRLFTALLGLLFATVLTNQASALYDPGVGRFCSRDSIGYEAGSNCLYEYCHDKPLKYIDPWGKQILPPTGPNPWQPPHSWPQPHPPWHEDTGAWIMIYVGLTCTPVDESIAIVWVCGKAVKVVRTAIKCKPTFKRVWVRKGNKRPPEAEPLPNGITRMQLCRAAWSLCLSHCGLKLGFPVSPDEPYPMPGNGDEATEAAKCAFCCNSTFKKCKDGKFVNAPWPEPVGDCSFPSPFLPDDILDMD